LSRQGVSSEAAHPSRKAIRNPKQPWRKLSRGQLWTLESAVVWRDIFLTSTQLCGHVSSSPDSLWRLGYFDKMLVGPERQPKYRINAAGLAALSERVGA
jgi:hypothetical protein